MASIRPPAVAGGFYPASVHSLTAMVDELLDSARAAGVRERAPKALIEPHAGYIYSGSTAARGYAELEPIRDRVRRVILLGPVHRVPIRGLALPGAEAFGTPLGEVRIAEAPEALRALPQVGVSREAHAAEHSLEVQVPFLQRVLDEFELLPLAVGDASPDDVAQAIEACWGGPETLIVISSDLSHYHPYAQARQIDDATIQQILAFDGTLSHRQACGATPVNGMLVAARRRQLTIELVSACNSGDTAGDKQRVVGYSTFALCEPHV